MKKLVLSLTAFILSSSVFAAHHNYQCIIDRLEAYNSDYYYGITPAEIDEILVSSNDFRKRTVQLMAKECDPKTATFSEMVKAEVTQGNETEVVLKPIMTTTLSAESLEGQTISLKTTKTTTWKPGSKFIDVKNITIDLGSNNGQDARVTVYEASATGMGAKVTRLVMDCFKRNLALRCELETKNSLLKLVIAE